PDPAAEAKKADADFQEALFEQRNAKMLLDEVNRKLQTLRDDLDRVGGEIDRHFQAGRKSLTDAINLDKRRTANDCRTALRTAREELVAAAALLEENAACRDVNTSERSQQIQRTLTLISDQSCGGTPLDPALPPDDSLIEVPPVL